MATKIIHKKSSVAEKVPLATDLEVGELAINLADKYLYTKTAAEEVIVVGGGTWADGNVGFEVKNQTGTTIPKGTLVGFVGTVGSSGRVLVAPFLANGTQPSEYIVGLVTTDLVDGADGLAIDHGKLRGVDTSAFAAGTILYASSTVAGALTSTLPSAPNNKVSIAAVINSSANNGSLEIRVSIGSNLNRDELVQLTSLSNGETLVYNSTTGRFENASLSGSGTVTSVDLTAGTGISVSGGPITSSGAITVTNIAPDQTVVLNEGANVTVTGSYPNFTIAATDTNTTYSAGTGLSLNETTFSIDSSVVTLTGTQTLTNKTLGGAVLNDGYTEEVFAVTGTTPALSPTNGSIQTWTLTANSTPTAGTWAAGQSITLMIDDGAAYTITWTSLAVTWKTDGGVAPTLNTTGFTVITLWKVGTTIYGARVGDA